MDSINYPNVHIIIRNKEFYLDKHIEREQTINIYTTIY